MNAPMPIFMPSIRPSGRKRPNTFDVFIGMQCSRADLTANLYWAITGILETLEPGQRLWQVEFEIRSKVGIASPAVFTIKMPGPEFLAMAKGDVSGMALAIVKTLERMETDNKAKIVREAQERQEQTFAQSAARVGRSGSAIAQALANFGRTTKQMANEFEASIKAMNQKP